jgi:hypothetical protein
MRYRTLPPCCPWLVNSIVGPLDEWLWPGCTQMITLQSTWCIVPIVPCVDTLHYVHWVFAINSTTVVTLLFYLTLIINTTFTSAFQVPQLNPLNIKHLSEGRICNVVTMASVLQIQFQRVLYYWLSSGNALLSKCSGVAVSTRASYL